MESIGDVEGELYSRGARHEQRKSMADGKGSCGQNGLLMPNQTERHTHIHTDTHMQGQRAVTAQRPLRHHLCSCAHTTYTEEWIAFSRKH